MGLQPQVDQSAALGIGAINNRRKLFDSTNNSLDYFTGAGGGDPTKSPLYQSFLTKGRESISNTYDNAIMDARGKASSRGFGYASPNEQTSELGIRSQEAGALNQAPATALQETVPYTLQATGQELEEGSQLTSSSNNDLNNVNKLALQQNQNKMGMINSLSTLAGTILGGPLGGDLADILTKKKTGSVDDGSNNGDWGGETG